MDSPVDNLLGAAEFTRRVMQKFAILDVTRGSVGGAIIHADAKLLEAVRQIPEAALGAAREVVHAGSWPADASVASLLEDHRKLAGAGRDGIRGLLEIGARQEAHTSEIDHANGQATILEDRRRNLGLFRDWLNLSDPVPLSCERDRERVGQTWEFVSAVQKLSLPEAVRRVLLSRHAGSQLPILKRFGTLIDAASSRLIAALDEARTSFGFDALIFSGSTSTRKIAPNTLKERLAQAIELPDSDKSDWIAFRQSSQKLDDLGLGELTKVIDDAAMAAPAADAAYRCVHFKSLIRHATGTEQLGADWSGLHMDGLRSNLAELDREYLKLSRQSIADRLRVRPVPQGVSQGSPKSLSELSLIEHEVGKQRRHIPIRSLLARAGVAAQALKPCFMMSPASVSQFLPAMPGWFDVVIVDEASQMRPEESICALSRAKQAVIVGDPMQLPPTSFFDAGQAESTTQDEDGLDIDSESILDRALSALHPSRDLRWHYRSRHHSLIAFSNKEFYGDRLFVFPSPAEKSSDLGVSFVPVESGRYKASINPDEADLVVDTVTHLIRSGSGRSIGVVAVNQPQKDLLIERFDRLFAEDSTLEAYRAKWAGTLEEFFVKNLENVQGDERDIIVISTVYGPETPGGPVYQRFGPINSNVGHRRLNVLFTRAKERVVLVSSLKPEDIVLSEGSKPGVRALKRYLEYARSGRLEQGLTGLGENESPFETEVSEVLAGLGYEVEPQVGVAGYRIDLAVRGRSNRDHFVLGIECDGATYHSAKSARDRDRLRQEILERLGWSLYRIWSTDWFLNREREIARLRRHLDEVMKTH